MNDAKWLYRVLVLGIFLIIGQACTTHSDNDFSPIRENGKTLLPNLKAEKFIPENSLEGEVRTKVDGSSTIEWESIDKLLKQAQDQSEAELIAVFSVRDSLGSWYNYYLQPLGFSPLAMEEANGKTKVFMYELNKDDIGTVPRIAIAVIPEGEKALKEMENWILPKVDTEKEQQKLKNTCEYVKVAPAASVCWRGGCTYYPPIYEWDCSGGGSSDPSWNWPADDGDKSGGSGTGSGEPGKDGKDDECLPPYVDINGECMQPCKTGEPELDSPNVQSGLASIWNDSNYGSNSNPNPESQRKEHVAFIVPNSFGGYSFQRLPNSRYKSQTACKAIFTSPSLPAGAILVHTHPYSNGDLQRECISGMSFRYRNHVGIEDGKTLTKLGLKKGVIIDADQIIIFDENKNVLKRETRCGY